MAWVKYEDIKKEEGQSEVKEQVVWLYRALHPEKIKESEHPKWDFVVDKKTLEELKKLEQQYNELPEVVKLLIEKVRILEKALVKLYKEIEKEKKIRELMKQEGIDVIEV